MEDASTSAMDLVTSLEAMGKAFHGLPKVSWVDQWQWQVPPIDKTDLDWQTASLVERIRALDWTVVEDGSVSVLADLAKKALASVPFIPHIAGGPQGPTGALAFLYAVDSQVSALVTPQQLVTASAVPAAISRQVHAASRRLSGAVQSLDGLEQKVVHGSPLAELLKSVEFKEAQEKVPGLLDKLISILRPVRKELEGPTKPP